MDGRGAQIAAGIDVLGELRAVSTDLTAWRRLCPPGRLAELTEAVTSTDAALTTAVADDEGAREFAVTAGQEQERIDGELAALRVAERAADRRAGDLRRLADDVAAAEQQRPRLGELDEAVKVAERRSGELTEQRDRRNAEVTEAARAAENARDRAERHVSEMCNVVTSTGRRAEVVPEASVSALRGLYRAAVSAYAKVEVGQDLRAAADTAASEAARLRTDVAGYPEADVARDEFLLASVDGSDPAGRRAAAARAERERQRLDRELEAAVSKVGALGNELKGATPQDNRNVWIVLDAELRPTSAENGRFLLEQAVELQREAQFELDQANAVAQTVKEKAGAAAETVRAFGEVLTPLEALLDNATAAVDSAAVAEPLDGTAEQAKEALVDLRVRLSAARREDGDWAGKEFLRIRFTEPDPSLLSARIGEVVDEIAAAMTTRAARGSAPKRDGLTLLLRSVEAAVPKGFTVEVLKPDAVLRDERVPVEDMNEVFSGGQELTAAIILYCTLAALRANERDELRARHSGVLFLDNPIGKASAEYLLEHVAGRVAPWLFVIARTGEVPSKVPRRPV